MKRIVFTIVLLTGFTINLIAVPAASFLITFAQPDGSTFQAHLRGDENFSWIETENKRVLIKNKANGYFEFALLKKDEKNRLELVASGIPVIKRGQNSLRSDNNLPIITRDELGKIWQGKIDMKRKFKRIPAKKSP